MWGMAALKVLILVIGILWCREIFGRFSSDCNELREDKEGTKRIVIVSYWVLTAGVVVLMGYMVFGIVKPIWGAFK